ncbi:hypothetical protein [Helicobacter sp. T3_23-1059]
MGLFRDLLYARLIWGIKNVGGFFWIFVLAQGLDAKQDFELQMPKEVAKIYYEMKGLSPQEAQNPNDKNAKNTNNNENLKKKKAQKNEQNNTQAKDKKSKSSQHIKSFIESKKSQKSAQTTHYFPQDVPPPIEPPLSFEEILANSANQYPQNRQLCQMGDKKACFFAGQALLYMGGDLAQAQQYYWLSCALGMRLACDEYSKISASVEMLYLANFRRWKHKVWMGDFFTKSGKYIELQKVAPIPKIRDMQPR